MVADFPEKLGFLFAPARYKVMYGGRGASKSWGAARALLIEGLRRPLRVLCCREVQNSIADSVHQLLEEQIKSLGFQQYYKVQKYSIAGPRGTEFIFSGLVNMGSLKSMESIDIAWVEEAQTVRKASWEVLIPTIRKDDSEIWVTFNPELDSDDTYKRFVLHPPPGAQVVKVTWRDNPWFPPVLRAEMEHLRGVDPDAYQHVWEGCCRQTLDGAVFADELRAVDREGRICRVPYDATKPVHTFWDLGFGDNTSIWFAQSIGFEFRCIDFLSDQQKGLQWYLKALQAKPYVYGTDYLPHDAKAHELGSGRTIEEQMRATGRKVVIVPRVSVLDKIAAARAVFGKCWFDGDKCADGIQALRHYRYELNAKLGSLSREPLHDGASHPADAFQYLAVALREPQRKREQVAPYQPRYYEQADRSWMV